MKTFNTTKGALSGAAKIAKRSLSGRSSISMLTNYRIQASPDGAQIQACDGASWTIANIEGASMDDFIAFVEAKRFDEAIGSMPDGEVSLAIDEAFKLTVKGGRTTVNIATQNYVNEWPEQPGFEGEHELQLPGEEMKALMESAFSCISMDTHRVVLQGLSLRAIDGKLNLASTDTHRAIWHTLTADYGGPDLVAPESISAIATDLGDEACSFKWGGGYVALETERWSMIASCYAGVYPNYERVFPLDQDTTWLVDSKDLLQALQSSRSVARGNAYKVKLSYEDEALCIKARDESSEFETSIPAIEKGNPPKDFEIACNVVYLQSVVKACGGAGTSLSFTADSRPFVIKSADRDDVKAVIMPMALS